MTPGVSGDQEKIVWILITGLCRYDFGNLPCGLCPVGSCPFEQEKDERFGMSGLG